jgi:hypothetical protein
MYLDIQISLPICLSLIGPTSHLIRIATSVMIIRYNRPVNLRAYISFVLQQAFVPWSGDFGCESALNALNNCEFSS